MGEALWEEPRESYDDQSEDSLSVELLGLLHIGKLSKTFSYKGHDITIKTLTIGEELEAGLLIKEFEDTNEDSRAAATVLVAACIENINGKPIISPLGPSQTDLLGQKFEYIKNKMYWPTVKYIYQQYILLLQEQIEALEEFRKK